MSTILKALRRLEEEKASAQGGRPLREQVASNVPGPARSSGGRAWRAAAVALLLGLGAGGALISWMDDGEAEPVVVAAPAPAERAPAPATRPAPRPAAPPVGGPPEDAFASDVEIVDRPQARPLVEDASPVQPRERPKPGARRPVESSTAAARTRQAALEQMQAMMAADEAAAAAPKRAVAATPEPAPKRAVAATPEPAPKRAVAPTPPKPAPSPAPEPVPQRAAPEPTPAPQRAAAEPKPAPEPAVAPAPEPVVVPEPPEATAPGLHVERTEWHPTPGRRSAWLRVGDGAESRRVVEGDVIDGMIVTGIEPSGVVLEREGREIRRRLGDD